MTIDHQPSIDPREPQKDDLEVFEDLKPGDSVSFFEWPVEPLTVIEREEDDVVGERVRVEAAGSESFLYETDGYLWHYTPEKEYSGDNNPFPVENLTVVEATDGK